MGIFYHFFHRKIRAVTLAVITFAMVVTGTLVSVGGVAHADVPRGSITHVYINLYAPSSTAGSQYSSFINSLRQAAGHSYRGSTYQSQQVDRNPSGNPNHYSTGLIMATITMPSQNRTATLWITPGDLYVRGFTNQYGFTYQFSDNASEDYDLRTHMRQSGHDPGNNYATLPFGGNYNALSGAAGQGRQDMSISWSDLIGSVSHLATVTNPYASGDYMWTARDLMFLIGYLSESARFWDVYGVNAAIMQSYNNRYNGLPLTQQYLENRWGRISEYGQNVTAYPSTPSVDITGVGTLFSWYDVARYLAMMLNTYDMAKYNFGDWSYSQL
ncbi:ribosome-inactivating family protein [Paenibacillus sp. R14(2021)]|uniref:ribosome-inactivating family protein n=1 Tax=Paenibacillus sp. R14(2021) TaxID=2859228 RepID=UPI001C613A29|nr:ribosome-inactivating family protein [Paenibacillus sp. R14(2021)]